MQKRWVGLEHKYIASVCQTCPIQYSKQISGHANLYVIQSLDEFAGMLMLAELLEYSLGFAAGP